MRRLALAAFLALSVEGAASARAEPPAREAEEGGDDGEATIQSGKRPHLKLDGTAADDQRAAHAPPPGEEEGAPAPLRLGPATYKGVAPGAPNLPPRAPKLPVAGPARMTWPGFQVRDGVPTVFLELTGQVEWSMADQPGRMVYTLKNTTVPVKNNRRSLDVRAFKGPVKAIDARAKGKDVQVTVSLRGKVGHREHFEDAAGGFKLLVIELPGS